MSKLNVQSPITGGTQPNVAVTIGTFPPNHGWIEIPATTAIEVSVASGQLEGDNFGVDIYSSVDCVIRLAESGDAAAVASGDIPVASAEWRYLPIADLTRISIYAANSGDFSYIEYVGA